MLHSLITAGWQVTALGRTPVAGVRSLVVDLMSAGFDLGRQGYDTVVHVAGLAHRDSRSESERERFFRVNVDGTRNLLMALECLPKLPESLVLISTVAVYGRESGSLLEETLPRRAGDPYGASKRQAEDLCIVWCSRHNIRAGIARLPLVVGANAPGNFGKMVRGLARGSYMGIGSGAARHSIVLARDVGDIIPMIAARGGVFHLTDGYHPSFRELEEALCEVLGRRRPRRLPLAAARLGGLIGDGLEALLHLSSPLNSRTFQKMTATLTFSDQKARTALGWRPSRVLDHMVELVKQPWRAS